VKLIGFHQEKDGNMLASWDLMLGIMEYIGKAWESPLVNSGKLT